MAEGPDGRTPGFLEILRALGEEPALFEIFQRAGRLGRRDAVQFLAESGIGYDIVRPEAGESSTYPQMFGPDWLVKLINYACGFTDTNRGTEAAYIPVTQIHRPDLAGCSVEFKIDTARSRSGAFKISALGFSGGGGFSKTIQNVSSISTDDAPLELQVKAALKITTYENSFGEKIVSVSVDEIYDDTRYVEIAPVLPTVGMNELLLHRMARAVSAPASAKNFTEGETIKFGSTHQFSRGFDLELPFLEKMSISLLAKSEVITSVEHIYSLVPGYRYAFWPVQTASHIVVALYEKL